MRPKRAIELYKKAIKINLEFYTNYVNLNFTKFSTNFINIYLIIIFTNVCLFDN
jgi:hypothetical protein